MYQAKTLSVFPHNDFPHRTDFFFFFFTNRYKYQNDKGSEIHMTYVKAYERPTTTTLVPRSKQKYLPTWIGVLLY